MQGDFSRWTFNPENHFTRVLMQQGRVQLDADWNEQVAILLHTMRQMVTDMMGPHGTWNKAAFQVTASANQFTVNENGKYYVAGLLIEAAQGNEPDRKDFNDDTLVYLDVWERHLTYMETDEANQPGLREVALKGADTTTRAKVVWQVRSEGLSPGFLDKQVGGISIKDLIANLQTKTTTYTGLVQSLLTSNELPTDDFTGFSKLIEQLKKIINTFDSTQADPPTIDPAKTLPDTLPPDEIYAKVITPLYNVVKALQSLDPAVHRDLNIVIDAFDKTRTEIPTIDPAKTLPDTLPPDEIYAKVITPLYNIIKALQALQAPTDNGVADKIITRLIKEHRLQQIEKEIQALKSLIETEIYNEVLLKPTLPLMSASTDPSSPSENTDSCTIPPDAAYTGPENQLYRVEIHQGGDKGAATFKWSRENGTVIFPIDAKSITVSGNAVTVVVENLGRDIEVSLAPDDWVELTYDALVQELTPGLMFKVTSVDPVTGLVALQTDAAPKLPDEKAGHSILRRWDQGSDAIKVTDPVKNNSEHILEKGIHIEFGATGTYRTGDYWLIPARTAFRNIEWPQHQVGDKWEPKPVPPHGIRHYYAPLAIIDGEGGVIDCRRVFEQLGKPVLPE